MIDTPKLPLYSASFAEHLQQPAPEFLYHYTSQDGLLGIVASKSLWATEITYLNDAMEFGLPLGLLRDRVFRELQNNEMKAMHFEASDPARAARANQIKDRTHEFWKLATEIDGSPISVTCFCEKGDLLSQWRGYAAGGYGYSLGFSVSHLKKVTSRSGFILGKCIYDSKRQSAIISESVEHLLTTPRLDYQATNSEFWNVMTYGAFFKHPSFEEEQEWRLVLTPYSDTVISKFRKGKSMLIPYEPIPIDSAEDLGINHAFVGPCPNMALSTRSVESLLICNDIHTATVHPSSIPFRDW